MYIHTFFVNVKLKSEFKKNNHEKLNILITVEMTSKQQEKLFHDLINGNFYNPPFIEKKIVRIFLSSTFTGN